MTLKIEELLPQNLRTFGEQDVLLWKGMLKVKRLVHSHPVEQSFVQPYITFQSQELSLRTTRFNIKQFYMVLALR
jgi:hypothetical protein